VDSKTAKEISIELHTLNTMLANYLGRATSAPDLFDGILAERNQALQQLEDNENE